MKRYFTVEILHTIEKGCQWLWMLSKKIGWQMIIKSIRYQILLLIMIILLSWLWCWINCKKPLKAVKKVWNLKKGLKIKLKLFGNRKSW